jgi:hypothetical protein
MQFAYPGAASRASSRPGIEKHKDGLRFQSCNAELMGYVAAAAVKSATTRSAKRETQNVSFTILLSISIAFALRQRARRARKDC